MRYFNVKLSRDDLKALCQFKPEFKQILDEYDDKYNIYVHKVQELFGLLSYLSVHEFLEQDNKILMLKNLLDDYFFDEGTKDFISEFFITDNYEYTRFISTVHNLYDLCASAKIYVNILTIEENKNDIKEYLETLKLFRLTE